MITGGYSILYPSGQPDVGTIEPLCSKFLYNNEVLLPKKKSYISEECHV